MLRVAESDLVAQFDTRLVRLNYSSTTINGYLRTARRFLAMYPGVSPELYSADHIEQFLVSLRLSPRTFCTRLADLRTFFEHLRRVEKLIRHNPCDDVEKPRWQPRYRPAPTRMEYEAVRRVCQNPYEAALVELLYFAGLRISELQVLRWTDVDLAERRAEVQAGKGGKARTVVFPEATARLLGELPRTGDHLFPGSRPGQPRATWCLQRDVRRIGSRAHLRYVLTPHILRHGFARLCKTSGVPLEVAARLMGHASIQTTAAIYGRLDVEDLQRVYDAKIPS